MNFTETIPVLIPRELPRRVAHRAMAVPPFRQPAIDVIFIGINYSTFINRPPQQGPDRRLFDVRQHPDDDLTGALDHPEDRRLLLRQRPTATLPLQPTTTPLAPLCLDRLGMALMSRRDIDFVALHRKRPPNSFVQCATGCGPASHGVGRDLCHGRGSAFVGIRGGPRSRTCHPSREGPLPPVRSVSRHQGSTARTVGYPPGPCPRPPRSARSTTSAISED